MTHLDVPGPLCAGVFLLLRHGAAVDEEVWPCAEMKASGVVEYGLFGDLEEEEM